MCVTKFNIFVNNKKTTAMRNLFKTTVIFSIFVIITSFDTENNENKKTFFSGEIINLEKAISEKMISVNFVSNGKFSGKSILSEIKNLKATPIKICIPAGTYFQAPSDKEQDLIIPQDEFVSLSANQVKPMILNGYCTNSSNKAPEKSGKFKLATNKTPKEMQKLLVFLKGKKYENHTLQDAIWAITNKSSVSNIYGNDKASVTALRNELFTLTGQKQTWYTSPQEVIVNEDRTINRETASISGELEYQTKKGAVVRTEVFSPEGDSKIKTDDRTIEISGAMTFNFEVKVKGWKKGTYKVKIIENNKVLKSYDFVV
jgi:hypothetical protein